MHKKVVILGIMVILWMGFIYYMSSTPGDESENDSESIIMYVIDKYDNIVHASEERINYHHSEEFINQANFYFRKLCHFGEYFILGVLVCLFLLSLDKYSLLTCCTWGLIFCFLYACSDELHQVFINDRSGNFQDILIDTAGSLTAIMLFWGIKYVKKDKKRSELL